MVLVLTREIVNSNSKLKLDARFTLSWILFLIHYLLHGYILSENDNQLVQRSNEMNDTKYFITR